MGNDDVQVTLTVTMRERCVTSCLVMSPLLGRDGCEARCAREERLARPWWVRWWRKMRGQ